MASSLTPTPDGHGDEQDERRDDGPGRVLLEPPYRAGDAFSEVLRFRRGAGRVRWSSSIVVAPRSASWDHG
jgi:hypothetical protein